MRNINLNNINQTFVNDEQISFNVEVKQSTILYRGTEELNDFVEDLIFKMDEPIFLNGIDYKMISLNDNDYVTLRVTGTIEIMS